MYPIILCIVCVCSSIVSGCDISRITDHELQRRTGWSAVDIVDAIRDDNTQYPLHVAYISAPSDIPHRLAYDESDTFARTFSRGLYNTMRKHAYEISYAYNFSVYHAQPVINEIQRRLDTMSLPDISIGWHHSRFWYMPTICVAVIGGSPQLVQYLMYAGCSVNAQMPNTMTATDLAASLIMQRIPYACDEDYTAMSQVLLQLRNNHGKAAWINPQCIDTSENIQRESTSESHRHAHIISKRYAQLRDILYASEIESLFA